MTYGFAVLITLATMGLRLSIPLEFGQHRPLLIIFVLPIIASALMGGLGPGILATLLSGVLVHYILIPPEYSFDVSSDLDLLHISFLYIIGILVSVMSESLHRSRQQEMSKRQELEQFRKSQETLAAQSQAIFERAASGIAIVDPIGHWLRVNQKLCDLVGYSSEELLSLTFQDITDPRDLDADLLSMQRLLSGLTDSYSIEKRYIRKDGNTVWIDLTVNLVRDNDNKPAYFIAVIQDIQKRKETEEALLSINNELKQAQAIAGLGKWQWDIVTDTHTWSEEIFSIYGRDPSLQPAGYPEVQKYFSPESWQELSTVVENSLKTGRSYQCDAEVIRDDGTRRWIIASGDAKRNEHGEVIYMHGTVQDITQRKQAELQLNLWGKTFELSDFGLAIVDTKTNQFLSVNPAFAKQRGYQVDELVGQSIFKIYHPSEHEKLRKNVMLLEDTGHGGFESVHVCKDGRSFPVQIEATLIKPVKGGPTFRFIYALDISSRKKTEQELQLWGHAFETADFALAIIDPESKTFLSVNPAFARQRGYTMNELKGKPVMSLYPLDLHKQVKDRIMQLDQEGHGIFESVHLRKDGSSFPVLLDVTVNKSSEGKSLSVFTYALDISERKKAESKIHTLAYFDGLTGLPNRSLLNDRIKQVVAMADREPTQNALILLNIDHFKNLNDARGHHIGDNLLIAVTERLRGLIREGDTLARFGGDEFAILLQALDDYPTTASHHAAVVASKLHDAISQSFIINDDEIFITSALGITLFPEADHDLVDSILRRADTALHKAKQNGGNQTVFFESAMGRAVEQHFQIERELHKGVESGELRLHLQSQVDANGRITGAEALIRWQHPQRGLISPALFIPIAEDSDLICEIDNWVFAEVCQILASDEMKARPLRIAVNISARHFRQQSFVNSIKNQLLATGANPNQLTLEVTESLVIDNINTVISKMIELSKLGIHFSIDDFGTGYSSLSYLKSMPIHELKIDKVFVQDAPNDADDAALVETILAVAKQLHLSVVAEGVETIEQAEFLNSRASVTLQGYLYGKPEPANIWLTHLHENSILSTQG